jgi:hypothetical protein
MPENVNLNTSSGIIEVESFGKVTKEDSLASLDKINTLLAQSGSKSILVDVRRQTASIARPENIAKFAAKLPQGVKIAIVYFKGHPNDDAITFLAASAIAKPVNLRIFDDKADAVDWLQCTALKN